MGADPILYEMHMHTPFCKHARGEPEDYAEVAQQRGLKGIVVTDHNPTDDGWSPGVRMSIAELDQYVDMVDRARAAWVGLVDIRLGIESDYIPGMEPWLEKLHGMADFNHVLGSVHPHISDYKTKFYTGDIHQYHKTYFEHIAMAAETGLFDTIAHPDLVKNISPADWDINRVMDAILPCLDRIAATGTAMELNTSGLNKTIPEMNPCPPMLMEMGRRNIPVVIGADAHDPHRVAANFIDALDLLTDAGYEQVSMFLDRNRENLSIAQVKRSLQPKNN
jgi:histidinol-phosphatase (PHP family)